jgi:hypothetical protein
MSLHFSEEELAARRARVIEALVRDKLDGVLLNRQESTT